MNQSDNGTQNNETKTDRAKQLQQILSLVFFILGIVLCALAVAIDSTRLNITPGFGAVQMFQFLLGVTCLTLAGFLFLYTLRQAEAAKSLQADIGMRLAGTGLVFMYVAGFADLIGIGTHVHPSFPRPFVGPLQLIGMVIGTFSIIMGMLLYHTSRKIRGKRSSMEFLVGVNGENDDVTAQN